MANIDIYTKATCPFCHRAKALLNSKGAAFNEIAIDGDSAKREVMIERSGRILAAVMIYMNSMLAAAWIRCFKQLAGSPSVNKDV